MTTSDALTDFERLATSRRSVRNFRPDPVPDALLNRLLETARWAPSGYNLQPTHFVIVTDAKMRARLRPACMNQRQITDAPVVVALCGDSDVVRNNFEEFLAADRSAGAMNDDYEKLLRRVIPRAFSRGPMGLGLLWKSTLIPLLRLFKPIPGLPAVNPRFWASKQVMLAAMNLMLAASAAGLATLPMEGFDESRVKRILKIPRNHVVPVIVTMGYPVPGPAAGEKPPAAREIRASGDLVASARDRERPIDTMPRMGVDATAVPVTVEGRRYDIQIQAGLMKHLGTAVATLTRSSKAAIVTDSHVGPRYAESAAQSLKSAGIDSVIATIPAGEDHKSLSELAKIYDVILDHKIDRSTPILALGGGVVGDMTGFVAATVLRGVPFIQVPTTLLAMVDASVGGKTGINHATGKNLIGSFHQPLAVLIDPETLRTLPARELRGGLAECIKHDIIRDAAGFARLEADIHRALDGDIDYLAQLIAHNVAIKAKVVEADPFEKGERAHLNFGHTFGHAIETVSRYEYSHGECVALGMAAASRLAVALGMLDTESCRRIIDVIAKAGLPVKGMKLDAQAVADAMIFDKKVRAGRIRFILPDRIGHVVIRDDVPANSALSALQSLGE